MKLLLIIAALAAPIPQRGQHWTDTPIGTEPDGKLKRTRTIKNWSNYREPGGPWKASVPAMSQTVTEHPGGGVWDRANTTSNLQIWAKNEVCNPGNQPDLFFRRSDEPGAWINVAYRGCNKVNTTWTSNTVFEWVGVWDGTTVRYTIGLGVLQEQIIITDTGTAPAYFEVGYLVPGSWSLTVDESAGSYLLLDQHGAEKLRGRPVYGYDSDTDGTNPDGTNPIGVTLSDQGTSQGRRILRYTPDAGDLATAVGDVYIQ